MLHVLNVRKLLCALQLGEDTSSHVQLVKDWNQVNSAQISFFITEFTY